MAIKNRPKKSGLNFKSSNLAVLLLSLLSILLLTSCIFSLSTEGRGQLSPSSEPVNPTSPVPQTETATPVPQPTIPAYQPPYLSWIDPLLPVEYREIISQLEMLSLSPDQDSSLVNINPAKGVKIGEWNFIAGAPFYTLIDNIQSSDLLNCWQSGNSSKWYFKHILIKPNTKDVFTKLWGPAHSACVSVVEGDLSEQLWLRTDALGILPFSQIDPSYKILSIDGIDPLSPSFSSSSYPLTIPIYLQAPADLLPALQEVLPVWTSYQQGRLTSIALTGVTALVRDTAVIMEEQGIDYPAGDIQDLLSQADITHINNEVPFAEDCPPPQSSQNSLLFCSKDSYLELLQLVGTDIVELSGDHLGDWGPEAMWHTLELYDQAGLVTYGGGKNLTSGLAPVYIEHNGNRFAFLGCNAKSLDRYATASADNPGAARCDFEWMVPTIRELAADGYIVITTMQHEEVDSYNSIALQRHDFGRLADAGAAIVSGSQAHHPQGIEYTGNSFIHYGLGNLFFDQWYLAKYNPEVHANKDKSFIDLHYFYDGKHISTRMIPLQFVDNARPTLMSPKEKEAFFDQVFAASLWEGNWINLYMSQYYSDRN